MARSSVRLEGFGELQKQLIALQKCATPDEIEQIEREGARIMQDKIREKAPYDETRRDGPHLISCIIVKTLRRVVWNKPAPAIVAVDQHPRIGAPHAHLVEYGHGGPQPAPAHPFFRPGVMASEAAALSHIERRIAEKINQAAR